MTDFGDTPPLGNIQTDSLPSAYAKWRKTELAKELNCHCPHVRCLGPNVLVKTAIIKMLILLPEQQEYEKASRKGLLFISADG